MERNLEGRQSICQPSWQSSQNSIAALSPAPAQPVQVASMVRGAGMTSGQNSMHQVGRQTALAGHLVVRQEIGNRLPGNGTRHFASSHTLGARELALADRSQGQQRHYGLILVVNVKLQSIWEYVHGRLWGTMLHLGSHGR